MRFHRSMLNSVLKGAFVIAVYWLTAFVIVQFSERVAGGWALAQIGEVLAGILGVFLARRLNVITVAYVLGGFLAFSASELVLHSIYGNRSVQGGPTHFAVMFAGIAGVAMGAFLRGRATTQDKERVEAVPSSVSTNAV